jgi:4-hydroxybenzoate polyprenyltransferase
VLCGIHFYLNAHFIESPYKEFLPEISSVYEAIDLWKLRMLKHGGFIYVLAFFAFVLNLARELIKDMQDIEGDKLLYAKTLAITKGISFTGKVASLILLTTPSVFLFLFLMPLKSDYAYHFLAMLPFVLSILFTLIAIVILFNSKSKNDLKRSDLFVKFSMLMGIFVPYYWYLLQI